MYNHISNTTDICRDHVRTRVTLVFSFNTPVYFMVLGISSRTWIGMNVDELSITSIWGCIFLWKSQSCIKIPIMTESGAFVKTKCFTPHVDVIRSTLLLCFPSVVIRKGKLPFAIVFIIYVCMAIEYRWPSSAYSVTFSNLASRKKNDSQHFFNCR